MYLTVQLKSFFRHIGITIDRYPTGDLRRSIMLFKHFGINTIYDIGANKGQFAKKIRQLGYQGKIISFEPLSDVYKELVKNSEKDNKWFCRQCAIGDIDGHREINISKNSVSSSFQDMLAVHTKETPDSIYIKTELVPVYKFDTIFNDYHETDDISLLKIDTQGFEMEVLKGCTETLTNHIALQLELSLSKTYENESYFTDIIEYLFSYDFKLFNIEAGYYNKKSGQLYQFDGVFFRKHYDQK